VASLVRPPSAEAVPAGTTLFAEDFRGAQVSPQTQNLLTTNGSFAPCLTASSNISEQPIPECTNAANSTDQPGGYSGLLPDAPGYGALRVASNSNDSNGFLIPSSADLKASYDSYEYDGSGDDVTTFLLTNGADQLNKIGPLPGAGGYDWASASPSNDCLTSDPPVRRGGKCNGLPNGVLAIGLDAFDNWSYQFQDPDCRPGLEQTKKALRSGFLNRHPPWAEKASGGGRL
jgi:hypothetical protein